MLVSGRSGSQPTVSRRAVLGAAVLLAATGCELDAGSSQPASGDASPPATATAATPTPSAAAPSSGDVSADQDLLLLDQARAAITTMLGVVVATERTRPSLRRSLRGLQQMHEAHLAALDTAGPTPSPSADSAEKAPAAAGNDVQSAARTLERRETRLQQQLVGAALAAASGEFARLLASMNASIGQHLTQLPRVQ